MSELTDRLKGAQSGGGSNAPRLNVAAYLDMGNNEGRPAFKIYNKEEKKNIFLSKPILGIFIGHAMQIEAFDKDAGINGGTWSTSFYFNNSDHVTLFEPTKEGQKKKFTGNVEAVLSELGKIRLAPKKRYCLFILTEKGLICVRTNVTLAIADITKLKDDVSQKMILLVPKQYSAEDTSISKKTHGFLGKIAATNPPNYANLITGEEINEEKAIAWGIFEVLEEWRLWKEYKQKTGKPTEGEAKEVDKSIASGPDLPTDPIYNKPAAQQTTAQAYQANQPPKEVETDFTDLPF